MKAEDRACEIVASTLKLEGRVALNDTMETLHGWDSLSHMRLVLEIEEVLGRPLAAEEIVSILSVQSVATILASKN